MHPDELLKEKQEAQAKWERENSLSQAQVGSRTMGLTNASATPHPREVLLADINDQEQRLLDKLVALREAKNEILYLGRDEAERLLKISRLMQRFM